MNVLELKKVTKRYDSQDGGPSLEVLNDLDLNVATGEFIAITGASGCGKSTLMNLIGTLDEPSAGEIIFDERNLTKMSDREKSRLRNVEIGFVFQLHHLLPQCTALENVLMPTIPIGKGRDHDTIERAKDLLTRTGLAERMSHRPALLSGGERQRVALVRALINSPKLLLADEPTGSLDETASLELMEMLAELRISENLTMILVTHSSKIAELADVSYIMQDKRLTRTAATSSI